MLNRITINTLLKSVIVVLATVVVVQLAFGAWTSWTRYKNVNRISAAAEASAHLFKALHNLRIDRSTTSRELNNDKVATEPSVLLKNTRNAEMPLNKAGLEALKNVDFPEREASVAALSQGIAKLESLHQQTTSAMAQPKASRPSGLPQEFFGHANSLMTLLDKISSQLTRSVKLEDSFIDQLMELKQPTGVSRNSAGDASVMISNGLGGLPLPPEPMQTYSNNLAKLDTAWAAVKSVADGHSVAEVAHGRHRQRGQGIPRAGIHRAAAEEYKGADRGREARHQG